MRPQVSLAAIVVALAFAAPAGAQKQYRAERYDVDLQLRADGSMWVSEQVRLRFDGGPFTRLIRQIPRRRTDGVGDIRGQVDGRAWPPATGGGRFEVKRENGVQVTWRFPATQDAARLFGLSYRARGVVERRPDADLFVWETLPLDHDYPIDEATIRVRWPSGGRLLGQPTVAPTGAVVEAADTEFSVRLDRVPPDGRLRVSARFESGSITSATPQWQVRDDTGDRLRPTMLATFGAILLVGFAGLLVLLNGMRREPVGIDRNARAHQPPSTLPVAIAAASSAPGAWPTYYHAFGALIDLARRGAIGFAETGERAWYRPQTFRVTLLERPAVASRHEQVLLDALFQDKGAARTSLTFGEALTALRRAWSRWRRALAADTDDLGFFSPDRQRVRHLLIGAGIVTTAVSFVCFLALAVLSDRYSGWPMLGPGAFGLVGLGILISGASLSPLSDLGRHRAAEWRAFFRFLNDVAAGRTGIPDEALFERYLPFAVALGIGPGWLKVFRRNGRLTASPTWFAAAAASDATRQLDAFMAMIVVTHGAGRSGSGASAGAGGGGASHAS